MTQDEKNNAIQNIHPDTFDLFAFADAGWYYSPLDSDWATMGDAGIWDETGSWGFSTSQAAEALGVAEIDLWDWKLAADKQWAENN